MAGWDDGVGCKGVIDIPGNPVAADPFEESLGVIDLDELQAVREPWNVARMVHDLGDGQAGLAAGRTDGLPRQFKAGRPATADILEVTHLDQGRLIGIPAGGRNPKVERVRQGHSNVPQLGPPIPIRAAIPRKTVANALQAQPGARISDRGTAESNGWP